MVNDPYLHTGGLCDIGVDQIYDERDVPFKERSGPGGGRKACGRGRKEHEPGVYWCVLVFIVSSIPKVAGVPPAKTLVNL